jgi:hypothetical protein
MPTILASAIINKAKVLLQDTTNVRWTDLELLGWLNDGQREVVILRPDSTSKIAVLALVTGTRQTIPADGSSILRVVRNMNGGSAGRAIRHVPMELLDSSLPDWHTTATNAVVQHAVTDIRMPKTFYVYPQATVAVNSVEILYSAFPTDVSAVSNTISVDDIFATPLIDYVCFRAYLKDQDLAGNSERAAGHRSLFMETMSGKSQSDAIVNASKVNVKG